MKQKQVHKSNRLVTMLLLVMAILMPYGGGHGHKLKRCLLVMAQQTTLIRYPQLLNWRGSAIR